MADPKKPGPDLSGRTSILGKIDAGIRAAANFVTFGYADKLDAMMSSGSYKDNMEKNKAINEFDEANNTAAVRTGQVGITAVAAAPGLVKAAVGKVAQVGSNLFAKATGRAATAEVAVAQTAARVMPAAVAAPAIPAAAPAATSLAGKAASLTGKAVKKTAKVGLAMGVPLVVADAVVSSAMEAQAGDKPKTAEEIAGVNGSTIEGGASAVASAITLAAVAPGAMQFAERVGERMAERMGGRFKSIIQLGEKLSGHLPDSVKQAAQNGAAHLGELAQSGATTVAKAFGVAYVGGEVVAGQYVSDSNSNTPSMLVQAVDVVRDTYADLKKAGLDRGAGGSVSGALVASATVLVTELTEGLVPGIANISAKEQQLLLAKDADFNNPHMIRLLATHMGSEIAAIDRDIRMKGAMLDAEFAPLLKAPGMPATAEEWKAQAATMTDAELQAHPFYKYDMARIELEQQQRTAMLAVDERWRPAQQNLDAYLASGKADLSNPAIATLAAARMQDDITAAQRKFDSGLFRDGSFDYRQGSWAFDDSAKLETLRTERAAAMAALEAKWKPVDERMAALASPQAPAATAAAPAVEIHAQAPAAPAQPAAAKPAQHKPAPIKSAAVRPNELMGPPAPDTPHESFNAQAALPDPDPAIAAAYAAAAGATVTVAGLTPEMVTLPPLVGAGGAMLSGASSTVDLSGLMPKPVEEAAALPDPDLERARPIALNTRAPGASTSFG